MKFIVDAQLPKVLSDFLNKEGYDSIHTLDLNNKNKTTDENIIATAIEQNRIVITKDHDFLDSYLLKRKPPKLVLVRTGNTPNKKLLELFQQNIQTITELLKEVSLIEINIDEIISHLSK